MKKKLEEIAKEDGRFCSQAFRFVYEGLGYTVKNIGSKPTHVSGQTLCRGLADLAVEKFGWMALLVMNSWNLKSTRDFGEIVYAMIKYKWMSVQSTDSIDDFNDVYDFKTCFKDNFKF